MVDTYNFFRGTALAVGLLMVGGCDYARTPESVVARFSSGDTTILREYLDSGGNPNAITKKDSRISQRTLLHNAVLYGSVAEVRILLSRGADPNAGEFNGITPLMLAFTIDEECSRDRLRKIQLLLAVSNISKQNIGGKTALDYARKYGSPAELDLLEAATQKQASGRVP